MTTEIETKIKELLSYIRSNSDSHEAMRFTQAILNLAHAEATLTGAKQLKNK